MYNQYRIAFMGPQPGDNIEETSNQYYLIIPKSYTVIEKCFFFAMQIKSKIKAMTDLIDDILSAEDHLSQGLFFNSGLRLGYAISRMLA